MVKFVAAMIAFVLAGSLAACGSDDSTAHSTGRQQTPEPTLLEDVGESFADESPLAAILALIPNTPLFREHLLIDDLAARRSVLGVELPDADTPEEELWKYTGSLIQFPGEEHFVPITRDHGQLITGFPENVNTTEGIGFDVRNIDQSLHVRGNRDRRVEIVLGTFDPALADRLIANCQNCVPVQLLSHGGADFYAWAVADRSGDFRYAPPITDASGEGGFFWVTDSFAVRALHQADIEHLIETTAGNSASLLDDEDYALALSLLDRRDNIDATFSGKTLSLSLALKDLEETIEYQGEHFETVDDVEATLRSTGLLRPYRLYASTVRFEDGEFVVTNLLVHDDEEAAQANVGLLESRIENGMNIRGDRWSKFIDSYDVSTSGRVLIAELRSSDSSVTFLRMSPTDTPSSLIPLYSTLFTHADVPGTEAPFPAFPTPTPLPTAPPTTVPGSQVGEQEPACLDRGGGGSYRDGFNRIYLLMHPPEAGTTDAQAVAQHLCVRGGSWVPNGNIVVRQADYLWSDLQKWRQDPVMWSDGVYAIGTDVAENRISVSVSTPYAAEQLRKSLEASAVPVDAVIIEVDRQVGPDDPPPAPVSAIGIEISVVFNAEVRPGKDVEFEIVLTNRSEETLELEHGTPADVDVVILTTDGTQAWRHQGPVRVGGGRSTVVQAGDDARFPVTWSQIDQDGFPITPGDYLVRGFANVSTNHGGFVSRHNLSTGPVPLRVIEE